VDTTENKERACILCGRCLEVCPLFAATNREELSPRGKTFLIARALEQMDLGDPKTARKLLGLCLGCGRCAGACPQGRDLPKALRRLKAEQPGWPAWVWRAWIGQARHVWPWLSRGARFFPARPGSGAIIAGLKAQGHTPRVPALVGGVSGAARLFGPTVLFPGCLARWAKTRWAKARWAKPGWIQNAYAVMGPSGTGLADFPDWDCCGFTLGQAGLAGPRLDACRKNIALWREQGRPMVLTICATCHAALRDYAAEPELFALSADRQANEAERRLWRQGVRSLSEVLDPGDFTRLDETRVMYHRPCHASDPDPDAALLRGIFGRAMSLGERNACCGMGGAMRLSAPELSLRVGRWYWKNVPDPDILRVVTGCGGCVVQLASLAPENVIVTHWLDMFA